MTNFEKWRAGLALEDLINIIAPVYKSCEPCPASYFCDDSEGSCADAINAWASQEVGE